MRVSRSCPTYALTLALSWVGMSGVPASAQVPAGPAAGGPLVSFDFRVLTAEGRPLVDLKKDEVSLKVNGKVREIRSLDVHYSQPGHMSEAAAGVPPPPFFTNYSSGPGRDVLLVLDDESLTTGRERFVKTAVGNLLTGLSHRDRVGVVTVPRGSLNISPTIQHDAVQSAVATALGRALRAETDTDRACRTRLTLAALRSVFDSHAGATHTTLVFFSGGLSPVAAEGAVRMTTPAGECELRQDDYRETGEAANQAPIDFHVAFVPEDSVSGSVAAVNMVAGLENLAGYTGNAMIRLTGDSKDPMGRLVNETSAYYVASFVPDAAERTGNSVRVEVRVNRERTKVSARQALVLEKSAARSGGKGPSVRDMLRVATVYRGLPLRAAAYAAPDPGSDRLKVVGLFEPRDAGSTLTSAAIGLFDEKGKLTAQWTAQAADLSAWPVKSALLVKPGVYRMRVSAIDGSGRQGTVDQDIRVELTRAGPAMVSALVLGAPRQGAFAPRLQFGADPAAIGYLELYGVPKEVMVSASFDVAPTADGPALYTVPGSVSRAADDGFRVAIGSIPIGALPAGDVVVRAYVSVAGQPVGRVIRTLRKTAQ